MWLLFSTFLSLAFALSSDPAEQLRDLRAKASPDEKPYIERATKILEDVQKKRTMSGADLRGLLQVLRDYGKTPGGRSPKFQHLLIDTIYVNASVAETLEPAGAAGKILRQELEAEAQKSTRELLKASSNDDEAHRLAGDILFQDAGDKLKEYSRCLELNPNNSRCRDRLRREAEVYTAPHCAASGVHPGFKVLRAHENKADAPRGSRQQKVEGLELWVEPAPVLTARDIREVREAGKEQGFYISFTTEGRRRMAQATKARKNPVGNDYMVIMLGERVLSAPRVLGQIDADGSVLSPGRGKDPLKLEGLCQKTEVRELPAAVKEQLKSP